ncbi:MAG: DUF4411 family protein [Methylococcales bacterium]|nr:DUF4411 family protein [Methylococcales bacterium]
MRYLIDANIFIQAKNLHYRFEFCQGFWDWLIQAHQAGIIFSIDKVKMELKNGRDDDPVKNWMIDSSLNNFFLPDTRDSSVMSSYGQIMSWLASDTHYTQPAKNEFARFDVADAFLIAVAKTYDYTIVTHEQSRPEAKKRVLIPDAANAFGIRTIMIYDLLSEHAEGNFALKI